MLEGTGAQAGGLALLAVLSVYCRARPRHRWRAFEIAAAPAWLGSALHWLAHLPPWTGVLFVPVSLALLWNEDRDVA